MKKKTIKKQSSKTLKEYECFGDIKQGQWEECVEATSKKEAIKKFIHEAGMIGIFLEEDTIEVEEIKEAEPGSRDWG